MPSERSSRSAFQFHQLRPSIHPRFRRAARAVSAAAIACVLGFSPSLAAAEPPSAPERSALTTYPQGQHLVEQALGRLYEGQPSVPRFDARLDAAARTLARKIFEQGPNEPFRSLSSADLQTALADEGCVDPAPRAVILRSSSPDSLAQSMAGHSALTDGRVTHFGVAIVTDGRRAAGVLLLTERQLELSAFPVRALTNDPQRIAGHFTAPLKSLKAAITDPSGQVHELKIPSTGAGSFDEKIIFHRPGVNMLELLAEGKLGTVVVAIYPVKVSSPTGGAGQADEEKPKENPYDSVVPEAKDLGKAEKQVLGSINALRHAYGLAPLARNARLDALARHHAEEMIRLGFFGHKSPVEGNAFDRLKAAGIAYHMAAENLAESRTALDAQRLLERSPGHRRNILIGDLTQVGIAAIPAPGTANNVYLVELFLKP